MKDNFVAFSRNLIFFLICATTVVSTLFFLPTTSEFFEFNKFTAFLGITILGLLLWAARTVAEKRFGFTRTPLDIPILIIVATFFVATLSSLDQFISFVGTQGRAWPSFFAMATVAAFYFMATSNLKSKKQVEVILWTLIGATTIAAVIATAAYFGAFLPFDFASLRSFNPLGVVTRLAQLESFVLPITIAQALLAKNKNVRLVSLIFTIIASFSFILIGFIPSYIALAVGLIVLGVGLMKNKLDKTAQGALATIVVFIVLFLTMRYVPQVAKGTIQAWIKAPQDQGNSLNVIGELRLNNSVSWDIATQAIGKRPLFGTGLGTYAYAYTQLKPRVMNSTDQWSVRFDKPSSDFAEILTTTGIFGALAYLIFAIVVLRFVWTLLFKSSQSGIYLPLAAAIVGFIASNFVSTSSLATVIPFFVGLVLLAILAKATDENYVYDITVEIATMKGKFSWFPIGTSNDLLKTNAEGKGAKSQVLPGLFLIVVLAASAFAARYQIAAYRGEYYFHQAALATRSNNGSRTIAFLQQAISANPRVDSYHRNLSDITRTAAITLSQNKDLTDNQKNVLTQLAQVAIDQGKVASGYQILPLRLPGISAANVANWETLSATYQAIIGSIQGADVHAVNTLSQAVSLDPQNPILHDQLGLLYLRTGNKDLAQRKFEDSIIVKGDYGPAHYHLAKILIDNKADVARIVSELSAAKTYLPKDDPALPDIDKNLEDYNKQLKDLQAQQAQEATKQQTGSPQPTASPTPSPKAGAKASPTPSPSPSPTL